MGRVVSVVNGADNQVAIALYESGAAKDMTAVTRVQIEVDDAAGTVLDSNTITMDWATAATDENGATVYPITFTGDDAGLAAGVYRDCRVRLFDPANTTGVVWPEPLTLVVA